MVRLHRWVKESKLHRENEPAEIEYYEDGQIRIEIWYRKEKLHNENKPAYITYYPNGQK